MGHGKGQWDGAKTSIKNDLRNEHVKMVGGIKLKNAFDVVTIIQASMGKAHLAYFGVRHEVRHYFHEIKMGDVNHIHVHESMDN
jgi:hypothetical protein